MCSAGAKAGEWESRKKGGRRGFDLPELADIETKEVLVQRITCLIGLIFVA